MARHLVTYHVKKHDTRRKVVAKIKHKVCVNHGVPNADDGDTPVPKVDKNYNNDFVVRYYWKGAVL